MQIIQLISTFNYKIKFRYKISYKTNEYIVKTTPVQALVVWKLKPHINVVSSIGNRILRWCSAPYYLVASLQS